jgi:hypothetical protein
MSEMELSLPLIRLRVCTPPAPGCILLCILFSITPVITPLRVNDMLMIIVRNNGINIDEDRIFKLIVVTTYDNHTINPYKPVFSK